MKNQEKLQEIADVLDMEADELQEDTVLSELENWDSVSVLSFIAVMNEKFDKYPNAAEIRAYQTVGDLMNAMC